MAIKIENLGYLVVDDTLMIRTIIGDVLRQNGAKYILNAKDGAEALERLQDAERTEKPIHMVICDWEMPKMNGLELLQAIRGDEKLKSLLFLMVTTKGKEEDIKAAIAAGINNYIVKPFTPDVLVEKLNAIIALVTKK